MRIQLSLYDFLAYAGPGFIAIVIGAILFEPALLANLPDHLNDPNSILSKFLTPNLAQGIFYLFVCHLVGVTSHGVTERILEILSKKLTVMKRYYSDRGMFEKELFNPTIGRRHPEDFHPYSDQFVQSLKKQIGKLFNIEIDKMDSDEEYTEIFHLCRNTVIEHSQNLYSSAFVFLVRYNSTKLIGNIFFFGGIGFLLRMFRPGELGIWRYLILAIASIILSRIFYNLYHKFFRYYRNRILYGFYEYAVTYEKSKNSDV